MKADSRSQTTLKNFINNVNPLYQEKTTRKKAEKRTLKSWMQFLDTPKKFNPKTSTKTTRKMCQKKEKSTTKQRKKIKKKIQKIIKMTPPKDNRKLRTKCPKKKKPEQNSLESSNITQTPTYKISSPTPKESKVPQTQYSKNLPGYQAQLPQKILQ